MEHWPQLIMECKIVPILQCCSRKLEKTKFGLTCMPKCGCYGNVKQCRETELTHQNFGKWWMKSYRKFQHHRINPRFKRFFSQKITSAGHSLLEKMFCGHTSEGIFDCVFCPHSGEFEQYFQKRHNALVMLLVLAFSWGGGGLIRGKLNWTFGNELKRDELETDEGYIPGKPFWSNVWFALFLKA